MQDTPINARIHETVATPGADTWLRQRSKARNAIIVACRTFSVPTSTTNEGRGGSMLHYREDPHPVNVVQDPTLCDKLARSYFVPGTINTYR